MLPALFVAACIALALQAATAAAAGCPGADPCPWTGTPAVFGDVAPESIRGANDIAYDSVHDLVWVLDANRNQFKKYTASTGAFVAAYGGPGTGNSNLDVPLGIAVDGPGNVYIADANHNVVKKFDASGVWERSFGTGDQGSGDGQLTLPADVAVDSVGNVYVADPHNTRIQKFAPTGAFITKWGTPGSGDGQFHQHDFGGGFVVGSSPTGLAVDPTDNSVYAVDQGNNRVQKFTSAGGFLAKAGIGGSNPGEFQTPSRIAVFNNSMYVTESSRLQRLDAQTATFGGSPTVVASSGSADGQVSGLEGVAAGSGGLFTVEGNSNSFGNNRVQRFNISTLAFEAKFALDAPGQLLRPEGVASDPAGNVYVADTQKDRIVKYDPAGGFVWAVGSSGTAPGQFDGPVGIASDGTYVWVGDASNGRLQRIDASTGGNPVVLGTQGPNPGEFDYPAGIAVDSNGDLYVADAGQDRVQKFTAASSAWSVIHGTGTAGLGNDQLDGPRGVAVQGASLWIADTSNNRIKKVDKSTGAHQLTIGKVDGSTGSGPGQFGFPRGIAATPDFVYVSDQDSDSVQRFDPSGTFVDRWGASGSALGRFNGPYGISAQDGAEDSVFVVEWGNERVQRFSVGGPPPDTTAPVVDLVNPVDNSFTKSRQPAIDGTAGFEPTDTDLSFELSRQTTSGFEHVNQGSIVNGFWTVAKPTSSASFSTTVPVQLADGTYHLRAYQEDQAGNHNPQDPRSSRLFTVDNVAPVVDLVNPVDNSTTTSTQPAISGTAGNAASDNNLRFLIQRRNSDGSFTPVNQGAIVSGSFNAPKPTGGTAFSTTVPVALAAGTYHLRAFQSDQAGNDNPQDTRTSRLFTIEAPDTTPPALTVNAISPGTNGHIGDSTPLLAGAAGNASGDDTQVRVLVDKLINGVYENQGNRLVTRNGASWGIDWPDTLSDGPWRVRVEQKDAKNETKVETTFTIDTKTPTMSVSYPRATAPFSHYKQGAETTLVGLNSTGGNEKPEITAELYFDQPGTGFVLKKGRDQLKVSRSGGVWAITVGALAPGHWFARVYLQDQAGNEGNVPVEWYVDPNRHPDITIRTPSPTTLEQFREGDSVRSDFSCSDPDGDNVTLCQGPGLIDTSSTGRKRFEVKARDAAGLERTSWVEYEVLPARADKGIRVQGIEFMQSIQSGGVERPSGSLKRKDLPFTVQTSKYSDKSVTPVKKKSGIARVYVAAPSRSVDVYLYGYHGDSNGGTKYRTTALGVLRPTLPNSGSIDKSDAGVADKQRKALGAYAFLIPAEWTKSSLDLVAVAVPSSTPSAESCFDCSEPNGFMLRDIVMTPSRSFDLGLVEFRDSGSKKSPPSIEDHLNQAAEILPIPDGGILYDTRYRAVLTVPDGTTKKDSGAKMLDALNEWDQKQGDANNDADVILGNAPTWTDAGIQTDGPIFTPKECSGFIIQSCTYHRPVAMTVFDQRPLTGTTHELTHAMGRLHASKCGNSVKGGGADDWPTDQRGYLQGVALDRANLLAGDYRLLDGLEPAAADAVDYDMMSYCSPVGGGDPRAWISPRTWEAVLSRLKNNLKARPLSARPFAGVAQAQRGLAINGLVTGGQAVITSVRPGAQGNGPAGSPYHVVARNASGAPIADVPLAASTPIVEGGDEVTMIAGTVPAAGAESLLIVSGSQILATVKRSPNAPKVSVVSPKAGQEIGGGPPVTVSWKATDADGGKLEGTVDYSVNGGRTWQTIAAGETDGNVSLPSALLSASKRARVRVTVNDGWNETAAVSGVFRAKGAPPVVRIVAPAPKTLQSNDALMQLTGQGTDDSRRPLPSRSMRWYIGKRLVARGANPVVSGLAPGTRVLRLEGTDRLGRTATDRVKIRLRAATPRLFGMRVPRKLSRTARRLRFRTASTIPGTLRIGKQRFAVGTKPKPISVPVKPGKKPLTLRLVLKAYGKTSKTLLVLKRG
jgi:DNA-binding beta-propeller fold protein YncE